MSSKSVLHTTVPKAHRRGLPGWIGSIVGNEGSISSTCSIQPLSQMSVVELSVVGGAADEPEVELRT